MAIIKKLNDLAPKFGKHCYFSEGAAIIGDVTMGDDCTVWFNAVLRGDVHYIKIGNRVNIQDGSCLHTLYGKAPIIIGDDVTVGHNVTLHGCEVKSGALIGMGRETLERMTDFGQILLPTMAAATALGGSPGSAAARQFAAMLFSDLLLTAINGLLLPLTYGYIAACAACAAVGNEGLKRLAGVLKWVVTTVLTILLLTYVGYLTVSGVVAGTADAVAVKAARFTVSSMVPVVGGILSDAAETVLAGAGVLKNAVGVFGMLTILSICLVPFLRLGVHYLAYKLTGALAATVADGRVAGLIDQIGSAFGLVLGMTGASALLLLVSMVSAVSLSSP